MNWFRKSSNTRIKQLQDLEIVFNLLHSVSKLSVLHNIPKTANTILDATSDIRKYINSLKDEYK